MKIITLFLFFAACQFSFAGDDTKIIVQSDWSKPVDIFGSGHSLRARMIVAQGRSVGFVGRSPETQFYLEFQNVSFKPTQFYFNPGQQLHCTLVDANGKAPPIVGDSGGGGGSDSGSWIMLPFDSTIRLRANVTGFGNELGNGLHLIFGLSDQNWNIQAGDTNIYYLSGTFSIPTPTNFVLMPTNATEAELEARRITWSGTLELPKTKIPIQKP